MSGTWYPNLREELEAERRTLGDETVYVDEVDWESALHQLALDGNVDALEALREELVPLDYEELGWAD